MPILDAHTHVFPQYADLAVRAMDRAGVARCVTLAWHDGFGAGLRAQAAAFSRYPGRFILFGNVDFSRMNEPDFAVRAAEGMARDVDAGIRGVKVYKALGLEYRHPDGGFWRVDDARLDPIWAAAGALGIPVLIHTADPPAFWQPVDAHNFWNGVLHGAYAWWSYYRKGYPSREELLAERNAVIRRHPGTTFIAPHVGSNAECLDAAADDLDALPNLYYDLSARVPILGLPGRRAARARAFLLQYQDRVLFGTDSIYDDANVPTGMQAQCLYQPYAIPLHGADPEERYVETTAAFIQSHLDFLRTDRVQENPPFTRSTAGYRIQGLALPEAACEKLLWGNAARLLGP
ncbi:MAG TPA: amidohydrolase family protein [Armatimonadota bacterium]|nr:amidohydrolase family protein [Armatimonadota bacterium]HOS44115.1 amidohydrolase family protein [Armatimonadota bacterium]